MKPELASLPVFHYRIHGLLIQSQLDLHVDVPNVAPGLQSDKPDVFIYNNPPSNDWISGDNVSQFAYFKYDNSRNFYCEVPDLGRIWAHSGTAIHVQALAGARISDLAAYILGTGIGAILHQRQTLVLHGNAISVNGNTLLCLGDSGAGKSTLSAALVQLKGQLLADDVVSIGDNGVVQPGLPRIKLWQHSLSLLTMTPQGLERVLHKENKYIWPQHTSLSVQTPVNTIAILSNVPEKELEFVELKGPFKLLAILRHVYRPEFMNKISTSAVMLNKIVSIFGQTRVIGVNRDINKTNPLQFAQMLVEQVEKDTQK